jgi:hypothetical protein
MVEGYHVLEWNKLRKPLKSGVVELAFMSEAICEREKVRRLLAFDEVREIVDQFREKIRRAA